MAARPKAMRSSTPVRWQPLTLALLMLAVPLAACGGSSSSVSPAATSSRVVVHSAPSGFVVRPDISDPLCNGGRGIRLRAGLAGDAVVASGGMPDGSTWVAFSELYPGKRFAFLRSVTRECSPNREFGDDGPRLSGSPPVSNPGIRRRPGPLTGCGSMWLHRGMAAAQSSRAPMEAIGWSARSREADRSTRGLGRAVGQCFRRAEK
jgi:hypothetical protein